MRIESTYSALKNMWVQRELLQALIVRDVQTKYRGTILGGIWVVAHPLIQLFVYSFVFGVIFKRRWSNDESLITYMVMLFCGLSIFSFFSDALSRSTSAITSVPSFVKKVVFPLEFLPISSLIASLASAIITFLILLLLVLFNNQSLPLSAFEVPLIWMGVVLMTAGFSWILAAIGVFFRDISQIMSFFLSMLLFGSPVFYPSSDVPSILQFVMQLNPLTFPIESLRQVLVEGQGINWLHLTIYNLISGVIFLAGLYIFQKSRSIFADVI